MTINVGLVGRNSSGKSTLLESISQRGPAVHAGFGLAVVISGQAGKPFSIRDMAARQPHGFQCDAIVICIEDAGCDDDTKAYINRIVEETAPGCKIYLALTKTDQDNPDAMDNAAIEALKAEMPRLSACYRVSAHTYQGVEAMLEGIMAGQREDIAVAPAADEGPADRDRFSVEGVETIAQLEDRIRDRFDMDDEEQHDNIAKLIGHFIEALPDNEDSVLVIRRLFFEIGMGTGTHGKFIRQDGDNGYLARLRLRQANRWSDPAYRETNDSAYVAEKGKKKAQHILAKLDGTISSHDLHVNGYMPIFCAKSKRVDWFGKDRQKWIDLYLPIVEAAGMIEQDKANGYTDLLNKQEVKQLEKQRQQGMQRLVIKM